MRKEVAHYCDCHLCDITDEFIDVAEGPITPQQAQMTNTIQEIWGTRIMDILRGGL